MCADEGVLGRPWGDGDLDLGMCGGELGEEGLDEGASGEGQHGASRQERECTTYFMPVELPAQSQ